jgi:hypothetical protein
MQLATAFTKAYCIGNVNGGEWKRFSYGCVGTVVVLVGRNVIVGHQTFQAAVGLLS